MLGITIDLIAGCGKIKGKQIAFYKGKEAGKLLFHIPPFYKKEHEVINLDWQENTTRSAGKAAAGAIIGGALTGGIGLIAGAALGGKKKDTSTAILYFKDDTKQTQKLFLRCNAKSYESLTRLIHG